MEIQFEKQYAPELDCCLLLHERYLGEQPKWVVENSLNTLSAERGIPIEQLRAIAAPSLELERHIVENLSVPENRLRLYFPSQKEEDGVISMGFWELRRKGVRFRELGPEQVEQNKRLLIHMISNVKPERLEQTSDMPGLLRLLEEKHCTDHTVRLCLGIFLDPASCQEEFDRILDQAAALYREKMELLPPPEQCTFEVFRRQWMTEGDNLQALIRSFTGQADTFFIPSPFVIYSRLCAENNLPEMVYLILGGIWDDQIAGLMDKYDYSVSKLAIRLKVLADQRRLEILGALSEGPQTVDCLCKRFSMSPALLSYHMDQILRENLIKRELVGKYYRYSINYAYMQMLLQNLKHHLKIPNQEASPEE